MPDPFGIIKKQRIFSPKREHANGQISRTLDQE